MTDETTGMRMPPVPDEASGPDISEVAELKRVVGRLKQALKHRDEEIERLRAGQSVRLVESESNTFIRKVETDD